MKHALQFVGWASVIAGAAIGALLPSSFDLVVFLLYLLAGVIAGVIPLGIAEGLGRLEVIERKLHALQHAEAQPLAPRR